MYTLIITYENMCFKDIILIFYLISNEGITHTNYINPCEIKKTDHSKIKGFYNKIFISKKREAKMIYHIVLTFIYKIIILPIYPNVLKVDMPPHPLQHELKMYSLFLPTVQIAKLLRDLYLFQIPSN